MLHDERNRRGRPASTGLVPSLREGIGAPGTLPWRAIIFDWEGTAVTNRPEDASVLALLAEPLLASGLWLVVVSRMTFEDIAHEFCDRVTADCRRHLIVCANHGNEVVGFDEQGAAILHFRRTATADEDRALTAIAEAVREELVQRTHLQIPIDNDRLNCRTVDLQPDWPHPTTSDRQALLQAVESRLAAAGWHSGIAGVVELAQRYARSAGVQTRIISGVKHVEIGLTDPADTVQWVLREVMAPLQLRPDDVLVVGDAFGSLGDVSGNDARLRAGLEQAPAISVGVEPEEVPLGVVHAGGGVRALRSLLSERLVLPCAESSELATSSERAMHDQVASVLGADHKASAESQWELVVRGVRPELEHVVESWLTVSNGYLGVRGALDDPQLRSRPRTLVAGLYGPVPDMAGLPGLVPAPNWTRVRLMVDGDVVPLGQPEHEAEPTRVLDMRRAVLRTQWQDLETPAGSVTVTSHRLVLQTRRELAVQVIGIEAHQPCTIVLQSWLDPPPSGLIQQDDGADGTDSDDQHAAEFVWRTLDGRWSLCCAQSACVFDATGRTLGTIRQAGLDNRASKEVQEDRQELDRHTCAWHAQQGDVATFVRLVALVRNREPQAARREARQRLSAAYTAGVVPLLEEHVNAWRRLWVGGAVRIAGDRAAYEAQRHLNFATYAMLSAGNPRDLDVSIGARGLTGDAYLGHVFWDTDVFLGPFFACTAPAAARALLLYRYQTLPAACERARSLGYKGALYAWESADTGQDVTPTEVLAPNGQRVLIATGTEEHHISADIAYVVWRFWQATRDVDFLLRAGAEILVETARFWASRCTLESDGLYHIRHVIGPDEYHEGVDDNAFTNEMARQNLGYALRAARILSRAWPAEWKALAQRLRLEPDELGEWQTMSTRIAATRRRAQRGGDGIIEQFAGYFGLEQIDLGAYSGRRVPMDVLLGRDRVRHSQVTKQADVLMLMALLPDLYSQQEIMANYDFYEPRCGQGSSLSPGIHALVAARLGERAAAMRYLRQAAEIDLSERTGAAAQGLHMAALGSVWMTIVQGFAGLSLDGECVRLNPHVPEGWTSVAVPVRWHGDVLDYRVWRDPLRIAIRLTAGRSPARVRVGRLRHTLQRRGERWSCVWDDTSREWKELTT